MATPTQIIHQSMRARILTLVWTSLVFASLVIGLGVWTVSQLSSLREQESRLFRSQLFLAEFSQQVKGLNLTAYEAFSFRREVSQDTTDVLAQITKEYQEFERYYVDHKQKLLEIGSDLSKLDDTKQCVSLIDSVLMTLRNTVQSLREQSIAEPSLQSLRSDWIKSQQVTEQLLRGLSTHSSQLGDGISELLQRKSVALAYFNLAAVALFLVTLLVLGITIANNIHRDTVLSSEKVSQTFASMGHTLNDFSQAGHALSMAASTHDEKISETLLSLQTCQTQLSHVREETLLAAQFAAETCQNIEEGSVAIDRAVEAVTVARETKLALSQLFAVLDTVQKRMRTEQHTASKTQMLSYNASIEAARAGDNGRGFAVVALELSRLADMSTKATDEMALALEEAIKTVNTSISSFYQTFEDLNLTSTLASGQIEKIATTARSTHIKLKSVTNELVNHAASLESSSSSMLAVQTSAKSKEDMVRGLAGLSDILNHQAFDLNATFDQIRALIHGPEGFEANSSLLAKASTPVKSVDPAPGSIPVSLHSSKSLIYPAEIKEPKDQMQNENTKVLVDIGDNPAQTAEPSSNKVDSSVRKSA